MNSEKRERKRQKGKGRGKNSINSAYGQGFTLGREALLCLGWRMLNAVKILFDFLKINSENTLWKTRVGGLEISWAEKN